MDKYMDVVRGGRVWSCGQVHVYDVVRGGRAWSCGLTDVPR